MYNYMENTIDKAKENEINNQKKQIVELLKKIRKAKKDLVMLNILKVKYGIWSIDGKIISKN